MRATIICGGTIKDYSYIKQQIRDDDIIICADSGYDHAVKMKLKVDLLVGDFDSITNIPEDVENIQYPTRKDQTDVEIALDHARKMKFNEFLLLGATGSRIDHTLTNIMILKDCMSRGESAQIVDEHNKVMITSSRLDINESKGDIISLIPITDCFGVSTKNLEYPLEQATLYVGKGLSVSNVMLEDCARIEVNEGILLVIVAND